MASHFVLHPPATLLILLFIPYNIGKSSSSTFFLEHLGLEYFVGSPIPASATKMNMHYL